MSKWEMVKLGSINNYQSKSVNPMKEPDCKFELYSVPSCENNYPEIVTGAEIGSTKQTVLKGDVLLCKINPRINRVWSVTKYTEYPLIASSEWIVIRNNDILSNYLVWCFKSEPFRNMMTTNVTGIGGSLTRVQPKQVKEYLIPLPPINAQKQIVKTLDTASELLAMHKQQLAELDNLIKAIFYDMFGDPVENEKGWKVFRLSDCLSVIGGYAFKSTDFSDEGIPVIKIGNINSGVFHNKGITFWKYDVKLDKYLLHPNDIVISLTGTVGKEDYANVCILPDKYPDYYLNQRNAKLELKDNINVYYLLYILKDTKIKGLLTGISRGIRQANISNADILALNIPLPKVKLQTQFSEIVTKIEEQKALMKKAINEIQYLFDSLMSEYFE